MRMSPAPLIPAACLLIAGWLAVAGPGFAQESFDSLGTLQQLFDDGDYAAVVERGEGLLDSLEDDAAAGRILDLVVYAARLAGRSSEPHTQDLARLAIETNRMAFGDPSPELATSLSGYALVLGAAGDLEGAREHHALALAMREATLGADDPAVARTAMNLGDVLSRLARYEEATPQFRRALEINLKVYGPVHLEVANVYHNLGNNLLRTGDYSGARQAYNRSLAIKEELLGSQDPRLASTLITLGVLEKMTGNYEESRVSYDRALEICEASLGGEDRLTLAARNNLANLLGEMGEYEAALPLYERTLASRQATLGANHPEVAETHHNLGVAALKTGDPERARLHFEAAMAILTERLGPRHPAVANPLESLANIALARGDTDLALELADQALEIRIDGLGPDNPEVAKSRLQVGSFHLVRGERAAALKDIEAASLSLDRHLRETIAYLPERESLAMVESQPRPESMLFAGLLSGAADRDAWLRACWNWTLRRRGLIQEELAHRIRSVLEGDTPAARRAWADYREACAALGSLWVEGPGDEPESFQAALRGARENKRTAEFALARVSAGFQRGLTANAIAVDELASHLEGAARLVEFVRVAPDSLPDGAGPPRDLALILDPAGAMDFVDLGPAAEIDEAARNWRRALDEAAGARGRAWESGSLMAELDETGRELRRRLWDPVQARTSPAATLYVVPEGSVHLVDLAALPLDGGGYLIEEGPAIRLLNCGRDLARFDAPGEKKAPDSRHLLALGDIDFDADPPLLAADTREDAGYRGSGKACRGLDGMTWTPLPESRRELEAVAEAFAGRAQVEVLTGAEATGARLEIEAAGNQILHLATHGYFLEDCVAETPYGGNPLLLSGIVLAGANHPGSRNDGIVPAEELATMDLRGVELAVLSACDTGRGEIAVGEGVFGLRRAFDVAGAATVVMSLWPVPDDAARAWMGEFYAAIRSGAGAPDAARAASLARLRALRAAGTAPYPELWAGFIAVGDWR